MKRIKLDHWYLDGNELSVSLIDFYVRLKQEESDPSFKARIYDSGMNHLDLVFNNLEDSIGFIEESVSICNSLSDVNNAYQKEYIGRVKSIGEYKEG